MRRYSFTYFVGQSLKGLWRNGVMSMASITVLMSCLVVMGSFGLLVYNINENLANLGSLNEIAAFVTPEKTYEDGDTAELSGAVASSDSDARFLGWDTDPDAVAPAYSAGNVYTVSSKDAVNGTVTFYAIWENAARQDGIRVVYSASGTALDKESQLPADDTVYHNDDSVKLPAALIARHVNVSFRGWSTVPSPSEEDPVYNAGDTVMLTEEMAKGGRVTFYAVWSESTAYTSYKIVYDLNGQTAETVPTDESVRLASVEKRLRELPNVSEVRLVSKEETKQEELENLKDYPDLVASLQNDDNFYPDTFYISYTDNNKVEDLKYQLSFINDIYKINCHSDIADTVENIKNEIVLVFAWFMVILFVVSIFVIINTVKLSVFSRRQEISVMRYVGATNWFISLPFVFEGTFIGLVAGTIAYFLQEFMYKRAVAMLTSEFNVIMLTPFSTLHRYVLFGFLITGVLTGIIGSCISLHKYMKV